MRAKEFVEATAVKYGFSSKILAELGGGEKQRVLEFAAGCGCSPSIAMSQRAHAFCAFHDCAVISSGAKKAAW